MKRGVRCVWAACVLIATAAAPSTEAPLSDAFAGVPGVAFRFYPVAGSDAATLRASIDAGRPVDPHDGAGVDAITHWRINWRWTRRRARGCDLGHARVDFAATVTLPRLADPDAVPPALLADWTRYRLALERHEAGHVFYAWSHRGDVLAAIRGATCATAVRAAQAAVAAIVAHDLAYDRDTRHGLDQGASFPPDPTGDQAMPNGTT